MAIAPPPLVWAAVAGGTKPKHSESVLPSRPAGISSCGTAQLSISFPLAFAAMNHQGGYIRFTDTSRTRCLLRGWPTVVAVKPDGKTLVAERNTVADMWVPLIWPHAQKVPRVVLQHGQSGIAEIQDDDIPTGNQTAPCPTARWLRVAPPGNQRSLTLSARLRREATYFPLCYTPGISPVVPSAVLRHR